MQKERNFPGQCAGQTRAHESLIRRARKARNGPDPDTQASFGIFPDLTRPGWHKLLPDPDDILTLSMMLTAILSGCGFPRVTAMPFTHMDCGLLTRALRGPGGSGTPLHHGPARAR